MNNDGKKMDKCPSEATDDMATAFLPRRSMSTKDLVLSKRDPTYARILQENFNKFTSAKSAHTLATDLVDRVHVDGGRFLKWQKGGELTIQKYEWACISEYGFLLKLLQKIT